MIAEVKKAFVLATAIGLVTAVQPAFADDGDYQALSKAKMSLSDGIKAVEEKSGGKVIEAEFDDDDGGTYEIEVLTNDKLQEYEIDADSGSVREVENKMIERYFTSINVNALTSAKTSLTGAIAAAEKEVGGRASEAEVDRAGDTVSYEIEIAKQDGSTREVTVTADGVVQ